MEKGNLNIRQILFNFFSLPVFASIAVGTPFLLDSLPKPSQPTDGFAYGLGDGLAIIFLGGFLLIIVVLWWHYWMIDEIWKKWEIKQMRYANAIILAFPYFVAACMFGTNFISGMLLNRTIDSEIRDSSTTNVDLSNEKADIITYLHKGDSTYIVTGITENYFSKDTNELLSIIRVFPYKLNEIVYPRVYLKDLKFLSCNNDLTLIRHAFDSVYKGSIYYGVGFKRSKDPRQVYATEVDSIHYNTLSSYENKNTEIVDERGKKCSNYKILEGFWGHDFADWVIYYDQSDRSIYTVVNPKYYGDTKKKDCDEYLYLAKFNKTSIVYKVKFNWKEITTSDRFIGGFKYGNEFWLLAKKRIYKITVT